MEENRERREPLMRPVEELEAEAGLHEQRDLPNKRDEGTTRPLAAIPIRPTDYHQPPEIKPPDYVLDDDQIEE